MRMYQHAITEDDYSPHDIFNGPEEIFETNEGRHEGFLCFLQLLPCDVEVVAQKYALPWLLAC